MSTHVTFWDVQHGHATYIRTPNNRHIVVDLGTGTHKGSMATFSPLDNLQRNKGVSQLDYVLVTHPHLDHIDDILNFDELNPRVFHRPRHLTRDEVLKDVRPQDLPKFNKYFEINTRYNEAVTGYDDPDDSSHWGGLEMKSFLSTACARSNINNHSIILAIAYAQIKVVITGDNEACSLKDLMTDASFRSSVQEADVLLAPHHGREAGFHADFVDLVNPRLTVISDGRFCDTSATDRYYAKTRGWVVHSRSGASETRKCLTTRSDGDVVLSFGKSGDTKKPFLSATVD